jgi:pyruvate/2-oxoglutarate dehydrogenase complex dihydrolipoamide acyltransferase (E2) component
MAIEVTMPQMGESVVEGTVTKWLVKVGESVQDDQPLCEISTDKVDTEIPSPGAGVIARLLASEGQTLPVGALLAEIEAAGVSARAGAANAGRALSANAGKTPAPQPKPAAPTTVRTPAVPSRPLATRSSAETSRNAAVEAGRPAAVEAARLAAAEVPRPEVSASAQRPFSVSGAPRRYSPVVLRMAEERGIDLNLVPGTGIGGRVSKRDIEHYLEALEQGRVPAPAVENGTAKATTEAPVAEQAGRQGSPAAPQEAPATPLPAGMPAAGSGGFRPPVYQPRDGDIVEAFTRRRRLIAEHMVYSKTHAPHVGTVAELDITKVAAQREAHKDAFRKREGFALTMLPFAAMATVRALKEFPRMNASVAGDSVVIRKDINLGIAMDAEEGLVVPVVKGADTFSVMGLAREIERLHRKVVDKSLTVDDLSGGSFTLSNPGREGNLYGFAIINQPQVGILRMGEVKRRPVVIEVDGSEALAIRTMMYLALSYDHRVIDGVLGNRFLYRAARILEEADFEL